MAIDPTNHRAFAFGDFYVDCEQRSLMRDGERVSLTPKVFDLLLLLIENHGQVLEKDRLMKTVWPDAFVEEGNLTQNISVLRKTLHDHGQRFIQTVPRRGYRFVGQVRELTDETLLIEERSLTRVVVEETESDRGPNQMTDRQRRRRRNTVVVSVAAFLVLTAAGIGWTFLGPRRFAGRTPPPFEVSNVTLRTITSNGNVVYGVISPDGQFVAYSTVDQDNRYALWLQRSGSREALQLIPPSPHPVGPAAISHDSNWIYYGETNPDQPLKGNTIYRLPLFGGAPRKVLEDVPVFAALSPDDQRLLLHRFKPTGGVEVISVNALDGSDERLIASSNDAADYLGTQWSPDGTRLLFFSSEQRADGPYWSLSEMPAAGGAHKTILAPAQRRIWFIAWANAGRGIVMTANDPATKIPQLFYVSYPDGETRRISNDLVGYTTVSVGGEVIMAGKVERQSKIWITNWPGPQPARQAIERDIADAMSWTPAGDIVYDTNDDGRLHLWIAEAGGQRRQLSPDDADERQPDVSWDGKLIAFLSRRSGNLALWLMDAEGRNSRRLTADGVRAWQPRFAPDGQSIYFLMERENRSQLARISIAGGPPQVIADEVNDDSYFDISPDGKRIAYSIRDDNQKRTRVVVRALEVTSPKSYFEIEPGYFLRWTPDGQNLAYAQYPQDKKFGEALWLQPVSGGPPQQVLNVTPDLLYWAAWSRDGKALAISHGRFVRDIVLVTRNGGSVAATSQVR